MKNEERHPVRHKEPGISAALGTLTILERTSPTESRTDATKDEEKSSQPLTHPSDANVCLII